MDEKDISHKIERLTELEDRLGIKLDALSAFHSNNFVTVNGELRSKNGNELNTDLELVVSIYDQAGRVVEVSGDSFSRENFYGFETFSICCQTAKEIHKIRIHPKKT
jgi:hypothetical protein